MTYLLGVLLLAGYVIAFPPWVGNSYKSANEQTGAYTRNGTFGLRQTEMDSPIWDPPHADSSSINSTVRWPWQAATARHHVELSTMGIAWRIAKWLFLFGLALKIWNGISARNSRDRFVDMAWSASLGTAISILGLIVYGGFTAGYGLTDAVVVGGLLAGGLLGIAYGAFTFRTDRARPSLFTVTQLAWFVLGLIVSAVIAYMIGNLAFMIRGDPIGVTELGTSAYAGKQALINIVAGVAVAISGLVVSRVLAWSSMPRGLVVGVLVGALAIGAMFAFSF